MNETCSFSSMTGILKLLNSFIMCQLAICTIVCMKCRLLVCLVQRPVQLPRGRDRKGWGEGEKFEECAEKGSGAGGRSGAQIL